MANVANRAILFTGTITASSNRPGATWSGVTFDPSSSPPPASRLAVSSKAANHLALSSSISTTLLASNMQTSTSTSTVIPLHTPTNTVGVPDSMKRRQQSPALYITLIVLSSLIILTTLIVSWLYWRRHRRRNRQVHRGLVLKASLRDAPCPSQYKSASALQDRNGRGTIDEIVAGPTSVGSDTQNRVGKSVEKDCSRQLPAAPCPTRHCSPGHPSSSYSGRRSHRVGCSNDADTIPMTPLMFKSSSKPSPVHEQSPNSSPAAVRSALSAGIGGRKSVF